MCLRHRARTQPARSSVPPQPPPCTRGDHSFWGAPHLTGPPGHPLLPSVSPEAAGMGGTAGLLAWVGIGSRAGFLPETTEGNPPAAWCGWRQRPPRKQGRSSPFVSGSPALGSLLGVPAAAERAPALAPRLLSRPAECSLMGSRCWRTTSSLDAAKTPQDPESRRKALPRPQPGLCDERFCATTSEPSPGSWKREASALGRGTKPLTLL